jgi:hypothetical protein
MKVLQITARLWHVFGADGARRGLIRNAGSCFWATHDASQDSASFFSQNRAVSWLFEEDLPHEEHAGARFDLLEVD